MATKNCARNSNRRRASNDAPACEPTDDELAALADFAPAIDDATMRQIEGALGGKDFAINRRIALTVLTRSADQLSTFAAEDPDTYTVMLERVDSVLKESETLRALMVAAELRLRIADARELASRNEGA